MSKTKVENNELTNIIADIYSLGQTEIILNLHLALKSKEKMNETANTLNLYKEKYANALTEKNIPNYKKELYDGVLALANNLYKKTQ
ncbi:MAG: hypothetical protein WC758_05800 [Candidatus Woesearchaeota archaeon]